MTKILRVLFRFETEYFGPSLHISGNALRHALSLQLNTSVGIFTQEATLAMPGSYPDFFLPRTKKCFLHPYYEKWFDKISHQQAVRYFFTPQYVTFDLIDPPKNIINHIEKAELIQFGGKRNWGFGVVRLQDYLEIDLESLKFPEHASHLTFIAPVVYLPRFAERYNCRHKVIKLWNHNKVNHVRVVAPGQFFRIKEGKDISTIAKRGILRKVLFGHFGLGEYIVHNWKNN